MKNSEVLIARHFGKKKIGQPKNRLTDYFGPRVNKGLERNAPKPT